MMIQDVRWCRNRFVLVLFGTKMLYIFCKFSIIIKRIYAETTSSKGAIWDDFSGQNQHQRT